MGGTRGGDGGESYFSRNDVEGVLMFCVTSEF
jgi:hypothetical protein